MAAFPLKSSSLRRLIFFFGALFLCLLFISLFSPQYGQHSDSTPPSKLLRSQWSLAEDKVLSPSPRANAVIVMLWPSSHKRTSEAVDALRSMEDRFNSHLGYPYVMFIESPEDVDEETRDKVKWLTNGRASFELLSDAFWFTPSFLDATRIDQSIKSLGYDVSPSHLRKTKALPLGRFFSGLFWKHPAVASYDWLWRLDSDVRFHCDLNYYPFVAMEQNGTLFGFIQITGDAIEVQPSLAANVSAFMAENRELISPEANVAFSWRDVDKALDGRGETSDWTARSFYNKWEISHRSVWESELYAKFFEYLDNAGGFFYERWGDAPIHSLGISMLLRTDQVQYFSDMGYQHKNWPFECSVSPHCSCKSQPFNSRAEEWFNPQ